MNIPIYYDCYKCEGKFPHKDYDHESGLCKDCLTAQKDAVAKLQCSTGLKAIAFLLTLVPEWALTMEQGLDPTYYGTGSYEGDKKVHDRVVEIKGLLEKKSL